MAFRRDKVQREEIIVGMKQKDKKVVLAYSGGLDTSIILKWL